MTVIPKAFILSQLPQECQDLLLETRVASNADDYRRARKASELGAGGLLVPVAAESVPVLPRSIPIRWATEVHDRPEIAFEDAITPEASTFIRPRVEKTKEEQKARVKRSAEVFTPSWVCNLQNNLIDDEVLYAGAFNTVEGPSSKTWVPSSSPVRFSESYTWANYVTENRLEMTCGEGPYIASRYDTVSGEYIPVRTDGAWNRIGILDRKLRVVSEQGFTDSKEWSIAGLYAVRSTFGFEWQGDNLLLARLNVLNTFVDYHVELWGSLPNNETLVSLSEVISWNFWQMDGLTMTVPKTCTEDCVACTQRVRAGHDGLVALVRFGDKVKTFEELLPSDFFPSVKNARAFTSPPKAKKPVEMPTGMFSDLL